jgi:hypothetical protein
LFILRIISGNSNSKNISHVAEGFAICIALFQRSTAGFVAIAMFYRKVTSEQLMLVFRLESGAFDKKPSLKVELMQKYAQLNMGRYFSKYIEEDNKKFGNGWLCGPALKLVLRVYHIHSK